MPYATVAEKIHEASCRSLDNQEEFTCRCGQPVVKGTRGSQGVLTHKMPQCRAFLDFDYDEYMKWLNTKPN
jgi:hypothetical protein